MTPHSITRSATLCAALLLVAGPAAHAGDDKNRFRDLSCDNGWSDGRGAGFCEIREQTVAAAGRLSIDPSLNGGVSVIGWDRENVLVRSRVQATAPTEEEARQLAAQVRVEAGGTSVRALGPPQGEDAHWGVSFQLFVPRRTDVSIRTHNGGIGLTGLDSDVEFEALNGGVSISEMAGHVRGQTTNGGISVKLSGDRWEGEALDVRTTNGGISMSIPERFAARLETGTEHGGLNLDFPITVEGKLGKRLSLDLNGGGPLVRATTVNGGVSIRRH